MLRWCFAFVEEAPAFAGAQFPGDHGDDERGARREDRGRDLVGDDVVREKADQVEQREQAEGLAVPHIDIGYRAVMHGKADGVIEHFVAVHVGIAEGVPAQDRGGDKKQREQCGGMQCPEPGRIGRSRPGVGPLQNRMRLHVQPLSPVKARLCPIMVNGRLRAT